MRSQLPSTSTSLPIAHAASSMTRRPKRLAVATMAWMSHGIPIWCTHRMARVRVVIAEASARDDEQARRSKLLLRDEWSGL